jgi:ubiquinone/menaquinone biosynthesis C-methylase UbiE
VTKFESDITSESKKLLYLNFKTARNQRFFPLPLQYLNFIRKMAGEKGSPKSSEKSEGSCPSTRASIVVIILGVAYYILQSSGNILSGFKGDTILSAGQLQFVISGFCLSPLPNMLLEEGRMRELPGDSLKREFNDSGDINEDDYTKDSIYSLLYSLYQAYPTAPSPHGGKYQFTFNTWGISNTGSPEVSWVRPETEPQRHGMAAYQGLTEFQEVKDLIKRVENPQFLEIGCGTGAGANLITQLLPTINYTAVDMQKAAIKTCNEKHAAGNERLTCVWIEGGVGNEGKRVTIPDSSIDVVVISETHIAEANIGPEEKSIFSDIVRVLKPGGLFVWGNALPTYVWDQATEYLPKIGFEQCGEINHTKGAILARDEDKERVDMYVDYLLGNFPVMNVPYFGSKCHHVCDMLIKNFYRHPGTALYKKMETGYDSYMHLCNKKGAKATQEIF